MRKHNTKGQYNIFFHNWLEGPVVEDSLVLPKAYCKCQITFLKAFSLGW